MGLIWSAPINWCGVLYSKALSTHSSGFLGPEKTMLHRAVGLYYASGLEVWAPCLGPHRLLPCLGWG